MPWNPGIQDRSGELLAQGIGGGMQAFTAGLSDYIDKQKKENDNAKYAEQLFKNNPELQQAAGVDYETLRGMSARDKIQTGMAAIAKVHQGQVSQEAAQKKELQSAQMDFYKQRVAAAQEEQDQRGALPGFIGDMQQMSQGGGAPTVEQLNAYENAGAEGPMPSAAPQANLLQAFLGAAAKNPRAVDPRMVMQYLGDTVREDTRMRPAPTFQTQKLDNGDTVGFYGNTMQRFPAGKEKVGVAPAYPWIADEDDKVFLRNLQKVTDPKERDAIVAARAGIKKATGKGDAFAEFLATMMGGAAGGKPAPANEKRKKYNPTTGKFD